MWEGFQAQISPHAPSESPHCKVTYEYNQYCKYFSQASIFVSQKGLIYFGVRLHGVVVQYWVSNQSDFIQHLPVLMYIVPWKLFLWLIRRADRRIIASTFLLPVRILRNCERRDYNIETSFSMRMSQRAPATLSLHLIVSGPDLEDGVESMRDILSQECKNCTDQLRTVAGQRDMGKQFHRWLIEPTADQKWDNEKEIQIKLSNSYFLSGCFVPGARDTVENKTIPSVSRTTQTGGDTVVRSVLCDVKEYLAQPSIRGGFWEKLSEGWVARKVGQPGRKSGTSEERKRPFCLEYSFWVPFEVGSCL